MSRLYMILPLLTIGLATPAWAQQISEQEANQAAKKVIEVLDKALHEKDAAEAATLFTENAIRVVDSGPAIGRAAIEKAFVGLFKVYTADFDKIDQVVVISNDVIGSINSLAGTFNGPKGPEAVKGYATFIYVRDGSNWKIRMAAISTE